EKLPAAAQAPILRRLAILQARMQNDKETETLVRFIDETEHHLINRDAKTRERLMDLFSKLMELRAPTSSPGSPAKGTSRTRRSPTRRPSRRSSGCCRMRASTSRRKARPWKARWTSLKYAWRRCGRESLNAGSQGYHPPAQRSEEGNQALGRHDPHRRGGHPRLGKDDLLPVPLRTLRAQPADPLHSRSGRQRQPPALRGPRERRRARGDHVRDDRPDRPRREPRDDDPLLR